MNKLVTITTLAATILLSAFLLFYKLDAISPGFYIDEAMPAYSAYSLLKTGKDEYGKNWPLALRFYGSYNPPLYTYSIIPAYLQFGVTKFAVRFPSALFGLAAIPVFYLLLTKLGGIKSNYSVLVGTFLFAISPWLIFYSRVGYEVVLGLLLFLLGILFAWMSLKKPLLSFISLFFLSLSTYAAYTERFLVPMFLIGFTLLFCKQLQKNTKVVLGAVIFAFITQIPNLYLLTTQSFFPKTNLLYGQTINTQAEKIAHFLPFPLAYLLAFFREFLAKVVNYYSPQNLFFLPDPDLQRSLPGLSVFYPWMVIPYIVGMYFLWYERKNSWAKFIILLLFICSLPAAITRDPFSTHRALPLLVPLALVITLGVERVRAQFKTIIFYPVFSLLVIGSLVMLWRSYFILLPSERANVWGYGQEQLAEELNKRPEQHFIIDQSRSKPMYANLAFFLKYSPYKFQQEVDQEIKANYYQNPPFNSYFKFANLEARTIEWEKDIYLEQILVGDALAISNQQKEEHSLEKIFEIKDPLDKIIFVGYKTNPKQKCLTAPSSPRCVN